VTVDGWDVADVVDVAEVEDVQGNEKVSPVKAVFVAVEEAVEGNAVLVSS
jgi:hypothetical protein